MGCGRLVAAFLLITTLLAASPAAGQGNGTRALDDLDLEELMEVEVVSATRRNEPLSQVPGAITVLDEEDIFRSGATSIPEILKLVPGVHVAQMDTESWAVGVRGFNGPRSIKHLVMVDGRPIASPSMAGVQWANNNIPVSMIKRVEVVRGTWTSLWGADSFTGVINIITKDASETQGGQSVTTAGSTGAEEMIRYGDKLGESGHYRIYGIGAYKTGSKLTNDKASKRKHGGGGFRADWTNAYTDALSLQGEFSASTEESPPGGDQFEPYTIERDNYLGYMQFVWDRATGLDANLRYRTSYTREKDHIGDMLGIVNIWDMELQHAAEQAGIHRFTWGLGGQYFWDDHVSGESVSTDKEREYNFTTNAFAQDRITLVPQNLFLFLGAKLDYFGSEQVEIQPSARLLYTLDREEYWLALSRAARTDNRWQRHGSYTIKHRDETYTVVPSDNLDTEKFYSLEGGYRRILSEGLRFDTSLYINRYEDMTILNLDPSTHTATVDNSLEGTAYGMESQLEWESTPWLTLKPSVSLIYQDIEMADIQLEGESLPNAGFGTEIKLQALTNPTENTGFDLLVGYVDAPTARNLPGYFTIDAHASWKVTDSLMLELIGKNLGGSREQFSSLEIGPSLDLRVTWDF